jgi:site-specific DNA-methyltransferase (adenine-specific)
MRDVWEIPALRGNMNETAGYPTQKPLALLERLVTCFTDPGALVADLCCGSGTALVAAKNLGRRWVGVDNSAAAVKLARTRLSQ